LDEDFTGTISLEELKSAYRKANLEVTDEEILDIFNRVKPESK
jgi:Ca2+-binding EF-hand superfamily protein